MSAGQFRRMRSCRHPSCTLVWTEPNDDYSRHTGDGHGPCRRPGPAAASATMPANRTCEVRIRR